MADHANGLSFDHIVALFAEVREKMGRPIYVAGSEWYPKPDTVTSIPCQVEHGDGRLTEAYVLFCQPKEAQALYEAGARLLLPSDRLLPDSSPGWKTLEEAADV